VADLNAGHQHDRQPGSTRIGRLYLGDSSGKTFDFAFDNEVVSGAASGNPPTTPTGLAASSDRLESAEPDLNA
jgi:hypothetical protein